MMPAVPGTGPETNVAHIRDALLVFHRHGRRRRITGSYRPAAKTGLIRRPGLRSTDATVYAAQRYFAGHHHRDIITADAVMPYYLVKGQTLSEQDCDCPLRFHVSSVSCRSGFRSSPKRRIQKRGTSHNIIETKSHIHMPLSAQPQNSWIRNIVTLRY